MALRVNEVITAYFGEMGDILHFNLTMEINAFKGGERRGKAQYLSANKSGYNP
jgi:hypothetical protein